MAIRRRKSFPIVVLLIGLAALLVLVRMALTTEVGTSDQALLEQVQVLELENGIQVVLAPASGSGLTTVNVWIGAGSTQDPPDRQGLAHYLEHMAFKGSERFPGRASEWIESRGGRINAFTSFDYTEYHVVIPSEHTQLAIDLLADLVTKRDFSQQDMENERSVVLREWQRREDNPSEYLYVNTRRALLGNNPYAQPVLGTAESIKSITRADLVQWVGKFYVPGNMTIVVVGDVEQATLWEQLESSFGAIKPTTATTWAIPELVPLADYQQHILERPGDLERLAMAWAVPIGDSLEKLAVRNVLVHLLAGELGHEDSTTAVYDTTNAPGLILVEFVFPNHVNSDKVRNEVLAQLDLLLSGHVHREYIALTKSWLIEDLMSARKTGFEFAGQIGLFSVVTGDPVGAFAYINQVRKVGKRQLLAMAREHVTVETRLEFRLASRDDGPQGAVPAYTPLSSWDVWQQYPGLILGDLQYVASRVAGHLSVRIMKVVAWTRSLNRDLPVAKSNVGENVHSLVLNNGIRIVLLPDTTTNFVEVHVLVGNGVAVETAEYAGISRFTNDFLLYSLDYDRFRQLDASTTVGALFDSTVLTLEATSASWAAALPSFLQYIVEPAWDGYLEGHRESVIEKIRTRDEDPFVVARLQLRASLFGEGGYGNPRTGTIESVSSFGLDDLMRFHEQFYVSENMVIVAAGHFDPKLMVATVSHALGNLEPAAVTASYPDPTPQPTDHHILSNQATWAGIPEQLPAVLSEFIPVEATPLPVFKPIAAAPKPEKEVSTDWEGIQLAWVMIGFPGPDLASDDYATLRVLNSIMGSGSSSRLFSHLREREGDVYVAHSFVRGLRHGSFMNLYAQVLPEDRAKFIETTIAEIQEIAEKGLPQEELQAAIAREVGLQLRIREWIGYRALFHGLDTLYGIRHATDGALIQQIEGVAVEDVSDLAKALLNQFYISEVIPAALP
ncbi:MAG: insulinase family protein [Caldilineaceae bacterium SB0662_bin_9]|uniref:Insulinase family protein n=1 Tax=Caldilineaceae bacterium SB0662_bin_9 TaxID=2605258 RepID=A0A6B1DWK8_9CHLR|nr:insulinase family protein [Caldilineaceae bacterium SB0662_bin_9]